MNSRARLRNAGGRSFSSKSLRKVRFGSRFETTMFARYSLPFAVATPVDPAVAHQHALDRRVGDDLAAVRLERRRDRLRHRAHAAASEAPGADRAVDVAHVVMQQHVRRARRVHAHRGADDAAAREVRLDEVGLEVLAEEVGDAHRVEADRVVDDLLAELRELLAEIDHLADVARLERGRIRRRAQQQRPDELALAHHVGRIPVIGVRVARVVARELAPLHGVVGVVAEDVARAREGDAAAVGHDLQPVLRELEVAEQLRPQQAADVGAVRVDPALLDLAADRGAADIRVALEHQDLETGPREVGGVRQAVVARADHDRIVVRHHLISA